MFLFIGTEVMLFGSFFTAYFFVRVVNGTPWPTPPFHLPIFVAFLKTGILVTSSFTMHWALTSIKRGNAWGLRAGLLLTFLMGLTFLITQVIEYARIGFNRRRRLRDDLLRLTGPTERTPSARSSRS
jgi:cytochrome c oxidase subunit 3